MLMTLIFVALAIIFAGCALVSFARYGRAAEGMDYDEKPPFPTGAMIRFGAGVALCLFIAFLVRPQAPSEFEECMKSASLDGAIITETERHRQVNAIATCYNRYGTSASD
ncbi:MAG: hypothetical protein AABZ76_07365 [Pseudomonadota bacterium]